jgi:hypothetical protein
MTQMPFVVKYRIKQMENGNIILKFVFFFFNKCKAVDHKATMVTTTIIPSKFRIYIFKSVIKNKSAFCDGSLIFDYDAIQK